MLCVLGQVTQWIQVGFINNNIYLRNWKDLQCAKIVSKIEHQGLRHGKLNKILQIRVESHLGHNLSSTINYLDSWEIKSSLGHNFIMHIIWKLAGNTWKVKGITRRKPQKTSMGLAKMFIQGCYNILCKYLNKLFGQLNR